MTANVYAQSAWVEMQRDDDRFKRVLGLVAIPFLVLGILIPLYQLSGLEEGGGDDLSDRYATLLLEQAAKQADSPEPTLAPVPEPEPTPEAEETTDPEPVPEPEPEPVETVEPEPISTPAPTPPPVDRRAQAREKVQRELASALTQLQSLQSEEVVSATRNRPLRQAQRSSTADDIAAANVVSGNVSGGSGATVGDIQRAQSQSTELGPRERSVSGQRIEAAGGGIGANRERSGFGGDQRTQGRSLEEIQLIMDRNKGGIYAIYNRALRRNPALQGKLVIKLSIAPSGAVSAVSVVSSELRDADLERKVLARVRLINFGAKDVPEITINYPIFFSPS